MKTSFIPRWLPVLAGGLLALIAGCSHEVEQPGAPANSYQVVVAATNASNANQTNRLLAYLPLTTGVTQYYYGDFDGAGQAASLDQTVVTDAVSGSSLNMRLDDSLRVKTLFYSKGSIRDTLLFSFAYPDASTITLSVYRIDWATDLVKLRQHFTLTKSGNYYRVSDGFTYSTNLTAPAVGVNSLGSNPPSTGLLPVEAAAGPAGKPTAKAVLNTSQLTSILDQVARRPVPASANRTANVKFVVGVAAVLAATTVLAVVGGWAAVGIAANLGACAAVQFAVKVAAILFIIDTSVAHASELPHSPTPFSIPPAGTPTSPSTQLQGTVLQRLKLYTGFGTQEVAVAIPALGACCAASFVHKNSLVEFGFSTSTAVGRSQYSLFRTTCNSANEPISFARSSLTSLTNAGGTVVVKFGNSTFQGMLTPQGGRGTLTIVNGAYCPATAGTSFPYTVTIPVVLTAIN